MNKLALCPKLDQASLNVWKAQLCLGLPLLRYAGFAKAWFPQIMQLLSRSDESDLRRCPILYTHIYGCMCILCTCVYIQHIIYSYTGWLCILSSHMFSLIYPLCLHFVPCSFPCLGAAATRNEQVNLRQTRVQLSYYDALGCGYLREKVTGAGWCLDC